MTKRVSHHHTELVVHTDGRDDGVERKHGVEHDDLGDDGAQAGVHAGASMDENLAFDPFVQLHGCLEQEEDAAEQQNQIAAGKGMVQYGKQRSGEGHHPRNHGQQAQAHDHRQGQADQPGLVSLVRRHFFGQDGNEDEVVDTENDFQYHQRE